MALTEGLSAADVAAVTNNNDGFGGGNGWWVLIILYKSFGLYLYEIRANQIRDD